MKWLLSLLMLCMITGARAQTAPADTAYVYRLPDYDVNATRLWRNDTVRYRYNQMKYYVTTILPYLNAATALFNDVNAKLSADGLSGKPRRQYVAQKEEEMRRQFESRLKGLNETQGVLLIKLIARQTGLNVYRTLNEFKGGFAALKWQTWSRLHGFNLNKKYDPADERDLEHIMVSLGYPLPAMYAQAE